MRKLVATAGTVLLGLSWALFPSASAHQDHLTFEWREPVEDGGDVEGSVSIRAKAELGGGVDRWQIDVLVPEGETSATDVGPVCDGDGDGEKSVDVECEWDSTERSDGSISPNSPYRIVVTVWNRVPKNRSTSDPTDPAEPHAAPERAVTVANPPKPVDNLQLAYDGANGVVTVSWAANPEPDIAGYLVEERFESGDWVLVAKPTTLFWSTRLDQEGTYRYRVAAVRQVGSTTKLKQGPFRQPQSGMTKVKHKAKDEAEEGTTTTSSEGEDPEQRRSARDAGASGGARSEEDGRHGQAKADDGGTGGPSSSSAPDGGQEPVGSITFTYEGRPVGEGGLPPGDGSTTTLPQPVLSPIQPGSPGSVETRYADPVALPKPLTPEEAFDPGFAMTLPYPEQVRLEMEPPPEQPRILATVAMFEPDDGRQRAMMGVLAGGLCVFVLSMQFVFLNRRPRPTELLPASADWD